MSRNAQWKVDYENWPSEDVAQMYLSLGWTSKYRIQFFQFSVDSELWLEIESDIERIKLDAII